MRTNLRIILVTLSILVGMVINAQEQKLIVGAKAGMNVSNFSGDINGTDAKIGYNVGVTLDYALANNFYLLTGLDFTTKGAKASSYIYEGEFKGSAKATFNPMYLQLPIHAGYKLRVAENTKLLFRAGPYLAYGVGGKLSAKAGQEKADIGIFRQVLLKNFDFGLGLGAGVEFGKIGVNLGYDFGVINIWDVEGVKVRNNNFSVGLGYKF